MNTRILLITCIAFVMLVGTLTVFAKNEEDIIYPVAELGSCANEQRCRAYCDDFTHIKACVAFAEEHNLFSANELAEAKKFARLGIESGPGGCTNGARCKAYCEDVSHITECLSFAEQHGIMDEQELVEARKVAHALEQGAQLPGGCQSKEQCETYCEEPAHINECLAFAEAAGFMSAEDLEDARRVAPLMARGEMPGGCRSREQCEAYCSDGAHTEECAAFFEKAGFINREEAEMFRKTGGKGPGDCRGKEECEAFCNDPAHQEACFAFAKEHGLIPEEELEHFPGMIEQGIQERGGEGASPEAADCVRRILGDVRELQGPPSLEQQQRMRQECFPQSSEGFQQGVPEHFERSEGTPGESQQQFQEEFQRQYQQQYQQQYQEEFQRQLQQQVPEGFHTQEQPQSSLPRESFLGAVLEAMKPALRRFIAPL